MLKRWSSSNMQYKQNRDATDVSLFLSAMLLLQTESVKIKHKQTKQTWQTVSSSLNHFRINLYLFTVCQQPKGLHNYPLLKSNSCTQKQTFGAICLENWSDLTEKRSVDEIMVSIGFLFYAMLSIRKRPHVETYTTSLARPVSGANEGCVRKRLSVACSDYIYWAL